jgi:biopolymer transport protein ExbB/TolQ
MAVCALLTQDGFTCMQHTNTDTVSRILELPVFNATWVLWLLVGLSVLSVAVVFERYAFYRKQRSEQAKLPSNIKALLLQKSYQAVEKHTDSCSSFSGRVLSALLKDRVLGAEAAEEIMQAALKHEKQRYEQRLHILATIGSNAPFIGLFGTVLGIVKAFKDLAGNIAEASSTVMAGISEALVATAIGLMVAFPAVIAYNYFKVQVQRAFSEAQVLAHLALAAIKSDSSPYHKG